MCEFVREILVPSAITSPVCSSFHPPQSHLLSLLLMSQYRASFHAAPFVLPRLFWGRSNRSPFLLSVCINIFLPPILLSSLLPEVSSCLATCPPTWLSAHAPPPSLFFSRLLLICSSFNVFYSPQQQRNEKKKNSDQHANEECTETAKQCAEKNEDGQDDATSTQPHTLAGEGNITG